MKIFLNLLPPEKKQALRRRFYAKLFLWQWFSIFLMCCIFVLVMGGIYTALLLEQKGSQAETAGISGDKQSQLAQYQSVFEEANNNAKTVLRYEASHPSFTGLLEKLHTLLPQNVTLKKLSTQNYQVFLSGTAPSRTDFLALQENLKNEQCFESINAPISNLFEEQNVSFEIDFLIKPDCLQGAGL